MNAADQKPASAATRNALTIAMYHPGRVVDARHALVLAREHLGLPSLTHEGIDLLTESQARRLIAFLTEAFPDKTSGTIRSVTEHFSSRPPTEPKDLSEPTSS